MQYKAICVLKSFAHILYNYIYSICTLPCLLNKKYIQVIEGK